MSKNFYSVKLANADKITAKVHDRLEKMFSNFEEMDEERILHILWLFCFSPEYAWEKNYFPEEDFESSIEIVQREILRMYKYLYPDGWKELTAALSNDAERELSKKLSTVENAFYLVRRKLLNSEFSTKKDFETANRKKFCSRIATGEYDAVIISHSQFEKIPMSAERQRALIQKEIDEITFGIQDLKNNNGERFSIKQLEKTKKSLEAKLAKLNDTSRKDDVITFEELGVDRIFVDEAHYYKNLFLYTKMRNVGGIAQTEAQKSSDLYMKCRYLDELTGGKGVIFATGTPISNSMVELYTMQRYLQYNELEKRNLQHFDAWASTFGETTTAIELSPEGTGYRAKTRFAKFFNLPELMAMFKEVADIQTADMLKLPVPKANYHNMVIEPSEIQKELVKELADRAERVRNKMVDSTVDNMLKITNDGRKLALDQRLSNDMLEDFEKSKVSLHEFIFGDYIED